MGSAFVVVVGVDAPLGERSASLVATDARGVRRMLGVDDTVGRLLPLLRERVLDSGMTVTAVAGAVQPEICQRPNEIALADAFDVLGTRSVAALALHVVIHVALDAIPAGGRTDGRVAPAVDGMAAKARVLFAGVRVQGVVGVGVCGSGPTALEVGVAVTARRLGVLSGRNSRGSSPLRPPAGRTAGDPGRRRCPRIRGRRRQRRPSAPSRMRGEHGNVRFRADSTASCAWLGTGLAVRSATYELREVPRQHQWRRFEPLESRRFPYSYA